MSYILKNKIYFSATPQIRKEMSLFKKPLSLYVLQQ